MRVVLLSPDEAKARGLLQGRVVGINDQTVVIEMTIEALDYGVEQEHPRVQLRMPRENSELVGKLMKLFSDLRMNFAAFEYDGLEIRNIYPWYKDKYGAFGFLLRMEDTGEEYTEYEQTFLNSIKDKLKDGTWQPIQCEECKMPVGTTENCRICERFRLKFGFPEDFAKQRLHQGKMEPVKRSPT